ncbi:hypothetical protein DEO72_LG3g1398 [Vigna unguiculata]|uniref:Uncharacterized protein n=1 Tax=Vigna unguiculata TaxID=3917 RepID=A0A4D6LEG4_VIGUN|nr:hypothetical protein DEO72_LG3g1398 [Vigna unguiculata]
MILPAHGTAAPDPSNASLSIKTTHQKAPTTTIPAWLGPHAARRNCSKPPGSTSSPPGVRALPAPLSDHHRLPEHVVSPSATQGITLPYLGYRLAVFSGPPGAIPVAPATGFGTQSG